MNRKEILAAANKAVYAEDMDHDYGHPEDNFATIAGLWNVYLEAIYSDCLEELKARDVAAMMILLKVARAATSTKCDHWVDIAGYAACGGEIDGTPCEEETAKGTGPFGAQVRQLRRTNDLDRNAGLY